MTLKVRFTLIGIGITVFLILAPLLVFYARGFKYDPASGSFVKTGTLVVTTKPNKAQVFLNNEPQEKPTPMSVRFLTPGDYEVRVEKDGYQTWNKRLTVKSQLVSWANLNRDFITLFLKTPRLNRLIEAEGVSLSKSQQEIGLAHNGELQIMQADNGNVQAAGNYTAPLSPEPIIWENTNQIFELNRLNLLTEKQTKEITRVETQGSYVALTIKSDLYIISNAQLILLDKQISAFDLEVDRVWYIQNNSLKYYTFAINQTQILNTEVPLSSAAQIRHLNNQLYLILNGVLYVLNDQLEKIYSPVTNISWDGASQTILATNSNELVRYNPASKTTELILRTLTPITQAQTNGSTGYVFFAHEGMLKAIELDGRGSRNVFMILPSFLPGSQFTLSASGETLYVLTGNQVAVYSIY